MHGILQDRRRNALARLSGEQQPDKDQTALGQAMNHGATPDMHLSNLSGDASAALIFLGPSRSGCAPGFVPWWCLLLCGFERSRLQAPSCIEAGLQNSVSDACESTQTRLSETKSSMTATALARSQPRLSRNMDTVTYPNTWMTSSTVD